MRVFLAGASGAIGRGLVSHIRARALGRRTFAAQGTQVISSWLVGREAIQITVGHLANLIVFWGE